MRRSLEWNIYVTNDFNIADENWYAVIPRFSVASSGRVVLHRNRTLLCTRAAPRHRLRDHRVHSVVRSRNVSRPEYRPLGIVISHPLLYYRVPIAGTPTCVHVRTELTTFVRRERRVESCCTLTGSRPRYPGTAFLGRRYAKWWVLRGGGLMVKNVITYLFFISKRDEARVHIITDRNITIHNNNNKNNMFIMFLNQ